MVGAGPFRRGSDRDEQARLASLLDDIFRAPEPDTDSPAKRPTIPSIIFPLATNCIQAASRWQAAECRDVAAETAFESLLAAADLAPGEELPAIDRMRSPENSGSKG
jgi:hypothetical protein